MRQIVFLVLLPLFLATTRTFAQQSKTAISGTIVDKLSQRPIQFVNILLLYKKDSSTVTGTVTDKNGKFLIENVLPGEYIVKCSYIGYNTAITQDVNITEGQGKIALGTIAMGNESKELSQVVVTAVKPMLNTSIDRKSYDVTKDIMAQSGTASDVLKNIPSLEVDMDGNVSLRGAGDVMILINGRPSPLFGKMNKAEVLQQFPANTIERIEVITNPSARYKPDGTSGIINIVLKKNIKGGINGSITGNVGNRDRYNANAAFNYNPGKLNVFGNFGIRKDSRRRTNTVTRTYFDTVTNAISGYYTEDGSSLTRPLTQLATLGFTFNPNKTNSFGLSGNYSNRSQVKDEISTKIFADKTNTYTSYFDRLRYDPEREKEKDATLFYEHQFPGEDHTLRMEFTVAASKDKEDNHYQNKYRYPGSNSTYDNTVIWQGDNQQQLTIDYSHTISETAKLEAGYSASFNQQDFNFYGEYFDIASGQFMVDKVKTNQFLFNQSIHALYGTYQKKHGKFGYSLGLRLEEAIIKGRQITKDTAINNDYLKLYPTLHLAYDLKHNDQLQLNYSRRCAVPKAMILIHFLNIKIRIMYVQVMPNYCPRLPIPLSSAINGSTTIFHLYPACIIGLSKMALRKLRCR